MPVNVSIPQLDEFVLYGVQISINYGSQIGASVVLLIVLLLLTKVEKRTSPIFLINTLSLLFNLVRNVLLCLFFTSAFNESYAYFAGDYSRVPQGDYANSITATVFEVLTLISIEASLCLQVRVVCITLRRMYRLAIFILSAAIALVAIGLRMVYTVKNDILILQTVPLDSLYSLGSATNIATSISICWFSAVFVIKLGFALRTRRKLGLGQFGSMQIIFIMGCQTLIIPGTSPQLDFSWSPTDTVSQPCSQSYSILLTTRQCHPKSLPRSSSSSLSHHYGPQRPSKAEPRTLKRKVLSIIFSAATARVLRERQL